MARKKIMIMSDSAAIDTGFGRVAREIGTGLLNSGMFDVFQLGWFHAPTERIVPFRIIPTLQATQRDPHDAYAPKSFDGVVAQMKPDLVIAIGDAWMISPTSTKPRNGYQYVGYVPIDGAPVSRRWLREFSSLDKLVLYGDFGEAAVRQVSKDFPLTKIPHGVDCKTFHPLSQEEKNEFRQKMSPPGTNFIVGIVARNNVRKCIPRAFKAFSLFLSAWSACGDCGNVTFTPVTQCVQCGSRNLAHGGKKEDAWLYLHTVPNDSAGHDLYDLIERFQIQKYVGIPKDLEIGKGIPDALLNRVYNSFDLFTLPTGGEGWGLPILEAMSAGVPVLVTEYSGHVEFVHGAGEFIDVSEFNTEQCNNAERAIVDIIDYVIKLDRFYYTQEEFIRKWGPYMMVQMKMPLDRLLKMPTGNKLCSDLSQLARARALKYDWPGVVDQWVNLAKNMLGVEKAEPSKEVQAVSMEVI